MAGLSRQYIQNHYHFILTPYGTVKGQKGNVLSTCSSTESHTVTATQKNDTEFTQNSQNESDLTVTLYRSTDVSD